MYPLIRQYLRRVDAPYLALCVLCSALSVVGAGFAGAKPVGVQQQGVSAAYRQFIGRDAGHRVFHRRLPRSGPRLAAARHSGLGAGIADAVFAQRALWRADGGLRCGRHLQLQLVPRGRHDVPAGGAGQDQFYPDAGFAFERIARAGQPPQKPAGAAGACHPAAVFDPPAGRRRHGAGVFGHRPCDAVRGRAFARAGVRHAGRGRGGRRGAAGAETRPAQRLPVPAYFGGLDAGGPGACGHYLPAEQRRHGHWHRRG